MTLKSVALILALLAGSDCWKNTLTRQQEKSGTASENTKAVTFEVTSRGEIKDQNSIRFSITSYLASNGVGLTVVHTQFLNAVAAKDYFRVMAEKATKIVERTTKTDKNGGVVGERAELILLTDQSKEEIRAILWTSDRDLYEIKSNSPGTNLKLERYLLRPQSSHDL